MNIFISWSGDRSEKLAGALKQFLSGTFPSLKVWMSKQDIKPGSRWGDELNQTLESNYFGVLCLTPENLNAPWLLYEAGALAKSVYKSIVVPYRLGLRPDDISLPLSQFQGVDADESGTWNLVQSLNSSLEHPLNNIQLGSVFQNLWPPLKSQIEAILASPSPVAASDIERERQRVRSFCALVAGPWWERIVGDGIGFFQIQMDELHNSVRLEGHFYNEDGELVAFWNSVSTRIDEENSKKKISYLRECRNPAVDAKNWFHGYGDMCFEGSYNQGHGTFYDVNRDNPQMTVVKSVMLIREHDTKKILTMLNGSPKALKSLVLKMINK